MLENLNRYNLVNFRVHFMVWRMISNRKPNISFLCFLQLEEIQKDLQRHLVLLQAYKTLEPNASKELQDELMLCLQKLEKLHYSLSKTTRIKGSSWSTLMTGRLQKLDKSIRVLERYKKLEHLTN